MKRFADPSRCPSCDSPLTTGTPRCPICHLDLSGSLGAELYRTLVHADELVARMRSGTVTVPAPVSAVTPPPPPPPYSPQPAGPRPVAPVAPVVRASSVPKILLGLGAVCLLVAALVFLAVTWSGWAWAAAPRPSSASR